MSPIYKDSHYGQICMAKNYYCKYYAQFAKLDFSLSCCLFLPGKLLGNRSKLSFTHSFGPPINIYGTRAIEQAWGQMFGAGWKGRDKSQRISKSGEEGKNKLDR